MEISPKIVTVSENNTRFKKRNGFRDKDLFIKAFLISGSLLTIIVVAAILSY